MIDNMVKGKYRIVREIARSNDIVYEAYDTSLGRRIALKELNMASGVTGQAKRERIERFSREARAAGRLTHPNIVSIFDYGEEDDRYFIAMEFLEGQNLRDKMAAQGALPIAEALHITYQMLDALAFAHQHSVIHRDIKPDNIHILPGGQVKLTDFGIARLTEEPALTSHGQVFGTPSYMSPEQIEGKGIDSRSDLFSVGIVLYEMLSGRKPFTGDSVITITYGIMNAEPPPLNGVPLPIERVIRTALMKNPLQRPATAEQMKTDLKNAETAPSYPMAQMQPTGMGQTNMGYGLPGGVPPYNPQPAAPTVYTPASAPMPGQPWQWNGQPSMTAPLTSGTVPPTASGYSPQQIAGFQPQREPITLSPAMRTTLISLAAAILVGCGLAFGVVAFMKSYEQYRVEASTQKVDALMAQGAKAYNAGNYADAAKCYRQAQEAKPDAKQRAFIAQNLTASYIQMGEKEAEQNNWQAAKAWYDKAVNVPPNDLTDDARKRRADALDHLGQTAAAAQDRATMSDAGTAKTAPQKVDNTPPSTKEQDEQNHQADIERRRRAARQLIEEGNQLFKQGDISGAREKWTQVAGVASGTPESQQALELLNQTSASGASGNP